jgi:DNA-binding NarL/FixJ family response regulator
MNDVQEMSHAPETTAVKAKTRIVVVDDHELLRLALKDLLHSESDFEVCGEASDADEAFHVICDQQPDVAVIDVSLSQGNGLDLVKRLKAKDPSTHVIVLSMYDSKLYAERALRAGAAGYVNKQQPSRDIVQAIRTVLSGDVYLNETMTREMLRRAAQVGEPFPREPLEGLSDRELEIFRLIGQGMVTRQIAKDLHISTSTVETYRERLKTKLKLKNGAELTRKALQWVLENG